MWEYNIFYGIYFGNKNLKGGKMKGYIQQGDVLIFPAEIPSGCKEVKNKILREGETTGHAHRVIGDGEVYEKDGTLYMRVGKDGVTVKHEEHKEQKIKEGSYRIGVVREVDPFEKVIRQVKD